MELEIKRFNHTGDGIGNINNKVVFVSKTIPGDIIEVDQIIDHGSYFTGELKGYKKKSEKRTPILCPYYESCGGCQLMGLSYQEQLNYKQEKVKDILKKYACLERNPQMIPSPLQENYRNKITLQVKNGKLGLFENHTNNLVPIKKCLLVKEKTNHLISTLEELDLSRIEQILIKEYQEKVMIQILGTPNLEQIKQVLENKVDSLYINDQFVSGIPKLEETLDKYKYYISPQSFFQVNHEQTINLYNKIKEYLGENNEHVLDLYCGAASIGIYVSDVCKKITGIERNPSSIRDAKENILQNKLTNIKVIEGDVGRILQAKNTYDAIILDPPRTGLDKKTIKTLLEIKSQKIIYVSCDPITLARDLKRLSTLYQVEEVTAIDMFPNTYHIESIALLSKKCQKNIIMNSNREK